MNLAPSNLELVAFAHIKGSDGSAYSSNGFKLTQGSAGNYQLFLDDALTQEPTNSVYPYVVSATLFSGVSGSMDTGMITTGVNGNQTIVVRTIDQTGSAAARDFTLLLYRPIIPLS